MVSAAKKFWRWMTNQKSNDRLLTPIDEELIARDTVVKEMAKKIQSQDAQLSKIAAEKEKKKRELKKVDQEAIIISKIIKQKKDMNAERYRGTVSLKAFFEGLKKVRGGIDLCDKDDSVIFGKFGDIVIFRDRTLGITDSKGNIMSTGSEFHKLIWKPHTLHNQLKRKRILLPCNEKHEGFPDIEKIELPEMTYKQGKIKWARNSEKPLEQLLIDREKRMSEDSLYIERLEKTKAELVRKNSKIERELNILKDREKVTKTEMSKGINSQTQVQRKMGELQKKIVVLTGANETLKKMRSSLESINTSLISKVEEMGAKTDFRKILGTVQSLIEWSKINIGDTVIQQVEQKEEPANEPIKPGEIVKK